ncbi:MAG: VOC family protein [Cellvibrionaceae bacterium]
MPVTQVIPHLTVEDGEAALVFYAKAFGAEVELKVPAEDGKRLLHASFLIDNQRIMLVDDFPEYHEGGSQPPSRLGDTSVTIHLETDDADAAFGRALEAGATVVMPLENAFWGARYGRLRDPFGHIWSIGGPLK